jgi:hypothetical protein
MSRSPEPRHGKPVEFGYKAQIVDNADGVILDHNVEIGNPPDAPQLAPAIARITRHTGHPPAWRRNRSSRTMRRRRTGVGINLARPRLAGPRPKVLGHRRHLARRVTDYETSSQTSEHGYAVAANRGVVATTIVEQRID